MKYYDVNTREIFPEGGESLFKTRNFQDGFHFHSKRASKNYTTP